MKASLLAISISSVLAVPVFASAPQVDVELANQQTLQLIDGQMNAIDTSVQYKLNEQYANATPGTTATVDDVTYEKQSNGTWAAVGAASAALVAGLLSSSSSSSSSDNGNTIPELPVTTSMDSVGTWKVANNDSGYIVTLAGQEVYVDSSNVTLNNDGTATIVVNDRKLIVGINGDELYRVDQVGRPELESPPTSDSPVDSEKNHIQIIQDEDSNAQQGTVYLNGEAVASAHIENGNLVISKDSESMPVAFDIVQSDESGHYVRLHVGNDRDGLLIHVNPNGVVSQADPSQIVPPGKPSDNEKNHVQIIQDEDSNAQQGTVYLNGEAVASAHIENGNLVISKDSESMPVAFDIVQSDESGHYVRLHVGNDRDGLLIHVNPNGVVSQADPSQIVPPGKPSDNEKNHVQIIQDEDSNDQQGTVYLNGEAVASAHIENGNLVISKDSESMPVAFDIVQSDESGHYVRLHVGNDRDGQLIHINNNGVISKQNPNNINHTQKPIDNNRLKSIDPTKLQKPRSAIQQRLRG
ncbi:hypothetical protein [Vibrio coralliirubri]|uniref:hypothetical protein n=1 Tax=Vibrio coralliirubri TaxID=1516159 RepID=UPI002FE19FCF